MSTVRKRTDRSPATSGSRKRLKISSADGSVSAVNTSVPPDEQRQEQDTRVQHPAAAPSTSNVKPKPRINKLAPARPFPTVPTSVSATGPRSGHSEGKNLICITRNTPLGAYLRRCKNIIIEDGYKTLHLSAMGAAIPLLLQLSLALPPILPFASDEIHTEISTGTVELIDEILPDDDEEDIKYQTRGKSTLKVVIKIGDGERARPPKRDNKRQQEKVGSSGNGVEPPTAEVVYGEPEQMDTEMI